MNGARLFRKFLFPSGGVALAAVPIVTKQADDKDKQAVLRPSELPIYTTPPVTKAPPVDKDEAPSSLEETIGAVRREVVGFVDDLGGYTNKAKSVVMQHLESSNALLDYLREEENVLPRSGAVALSAVTGLVLGLRGGFFKRLIYASAAGGGMAAICYPREAEEYLEEGLAYGRQYTLIGYHLVSSLVDDITASLSPSQESAKKDEGEKSKKKSD